MSPLQAADFKYLHDTTEITYDASGGFELSVDYTAQALTRAGIEQLGQQPVHYNQERDRVEFIVAETVKANGQIVPVDLTAQVFEQNPAVNMTAPTLGPAKMKIVVFPALAVGDSVHLKYRLTRSEPMFPGRLDYSYVLHPGSITDESKLILKAPASMRLRVDQSEIKGGRQKNESARKSGAEETQVWHWRWSNTTEAKEELNQPSPLQRYPRVLVTNRAEWKDLAGDYEKRAADKRAITPSIQQLADEQTRQINDRYAQARKLYEWVTRNIRYVAVNLGAGGYVPRPADEVLASRYGDCKDHSALYTALLGAKGIVSDDALIDNGPLYRLPNVPYQTFNHVINYLPEFQLFVDTTNPYASFDVLDFELQDKPVLLTGASRLTRTPVDGGQKPWMVGTFDVKFELGGDADVSATWTLAGADAFAFRGFLANLRSTQVDQYLTSSLNRVQLRGTLGLLELNAEGQDDLVKKFYKQPLPVSADPGLVPVYRVMFKGKLNRVVDFSTAGAVPIPTPPGVESIRGWVDDTLNTMQPRQTDFICSNRDMYETIRLVLPEGVQAEHLPEGAMLKKGSLRYQSKYTLEGRNLSVERELTRDRPGKVCGPSEENQYREFAIAIDEDLHTKIRYRK